mmetsp:Transcript_7301/g.6626  ORF Transcript_7301/g.6626 Transcript_7301/m.6626 type:complete len:162 (-) Transcript_7301:815-1300(-)
MGHDSLGQLCVFSIYIFFALTNIVAVNIKARFTNRQGLILGSFGYIMMGVAGAFASYCSENNDETGLCGSVFIYSINIAAASLCGVCAGLLWMSQYAYIMECSTEETVGTMNGIFWSLAQASMITGSLVSAFVLGSTNHFVFYLVLLGLMGVSTLMFVFLP